LGGEVAQTMYTCVSKCVNDTIKGEKKIKSVRNSETYNIE
jgi:hypothetical protein